MMRSFVLNFALCALCMTGVLIISPEILAQETVETDDWVWVPGHQDTDGYWIEGFYREPFREGMTWVDPYTNEERLTVPGHWEPLEEGPDGYVWEPGHRTLNDEWFGGFWRRATRDSMRWLPGFYEEDNTWAWGYWQPDFEEDGYRWVPGYLGDDGFWVVGFWRLDTRDGYRWLAGYYAADQYWSGYWEPIGPKHHHIWVPGYVASGYWNLGFWRVTSRTGYTWVPGHWHSNSWTVGYWHRGQWRPTSLHTLSRYAHYHHHHGHGQKGLHKNTKHVRYVGKPKKKKAAIVQPKPVSSSAHGRDSKPIKKVFKRPGRRAGEPPKRMKRSSRGTKSHSRARKARHGRKAIGQRPGRSTPARSSMYKRKSRRPAAGLSQPRPRTRPGSMGAERALKRGRSGVSRPKRTPGKRQNPSASRSKGKSRQKAIRKSSGRKSKKRRKSR